MALFSVIKWTCFRLTKTVASNYWSFTYTNNLWEWLSRLNHPLSAVFLTAVLLYWPFLWILELTRYAAGLVKQGVWRKAIQNETTLFEEFKISVAASVGSAMFALGPSAIFLWMIWRVRQGPFGWFVTAGREVLDNFVPTRVTVLSLFTMQTCVAVFLVGLWPILFLRRWRHVRKLRREQDPDLLLKRVADENEWKILRITAMRRVPEVDWVGQPPGATEVRAALMRIEAQDSDYVVRREAALVLSKLHAEERFVLRYWGQGKPNHKNPSDLSVDG